jgi:hypothetical protein
MRCGPQSTSAALGASMPQDLAPFSLVLLVLGINLLVALVFVLPIGTFVIWVFVVALLVTAAILSALVRQSLRRWH